MHRRLLAIGFMGLASVLALVSCRASVPRPLSPEEVLRKTVATNASMDSVAYRLESTFETAVSSGSLVGTGTILHGGSAWSLYASLRYVVNSESSLRKLFFSALFVSPFPETTYVQVRELSGMLSEKLPPEYLGALDTWGFMGVGTGSVVTTRRESIDPDAIDHLLSQIEVTNNRGIERNVSGTYEYHYDVRTKSGAFLPMHGELFIDAQVFTLRKVVWSYADPSAQGLSAHVAVTFFDKDSAPLLPSYNVTTRRLSLDAILNTISTSSLLPTISLSGDTEVHND